MAAALAKARLESAMNALPPKIQKFFNTHIRKGENFELKTELNSEHRERRKEAVKRVIANMTVGKDVSALFADVLKCMQTDDLELKKLVYLYLMNYAKSQPELVILAVNSFVKDSEDPNPLIRALAVRTMGCLRAERIVDYLNDPLRKALKDPDPYVRKTAAICVAKLYDLKPQMTVDAGFLDQLQDLLTDQNPMVVANAVAALREIKENALEQHTSVAGLKINCVILQKLLAALNECTEWGQIFILESLSEYTPADSSEAHSVIERVAPRLSHANGAVVLLAIRVLLLYIKYVPTASAVSSLLKKMSPPLVSLISISHEMTYLALRNINLILQYRALLGQIEGNAGDEILGNEMRMFFCKYNDPQYVKMEKLEILLRLTTEANVGDVLQELKEYAGEVDVPFSCKAIRCIGGCAMQMEQSVEACLSTIAQLLQTQVSHVVQECVIVITNILRRYPMVRRNAVLPLIAAQLEYTEEEGSRCALLWAVGCNSNEMPNAESLLGGFVETFNEEPVAVQLQILTSVVYCDTNRRNAGQSNGASSQLLEAVLHLAMQSEHPDLRDRAVVYWRMVGLQSTAGVATKIIGAPFPAIDPWTANSMAAELVTEMVKHIGTLASLRHELPTAAVYPGRCVASSEAGGDEDDEDAVRVGATPAASPVAARMVPQNLLGLDDEILGVASPAVREALQQELSLLLSSLNGGGIEIHGGLSGAFPHQCVLRLRIGNVGAQSDAEDFAVQFNKNTLGLVPTHAIADIVGRVIPHGPPSSVSIALVVAEHMVATSSPPNGIQIAVKSTLGIVYFSVTVPNAWLAPSQMASTMDNNPTAAGKQVTTASLSSTATTTTNIMDLLG